MTTRLSLALAWAAWTAAAQSPCARIEGERLAAQQLALLLPAFSALPPDTAIAPAPVPGARRVFHEPELLALAKRFSIPLTAAPDICFEWDLEPLDRTQLLEAMREALPFPVTRLEITEISQYPAPRGRIEFKREGLGSPASSDSAAPVIWRGSVVYGENRKFSIWARVIVTATLPRVVAVEALKRGAPIHASQVRAETVEGFPSRGDLAQNTDEVVGKAPWRDIPAETPIRLAGLTQAPDVSRGDTVEVEVRAGAARLALTAKAESAGRSGELITVRNLTSNRVFAARVSGKGRARVDLETNHAN